jgi:hypothetical protein
VRLRAFTLGVQAQIDTTTNQVEIDRLSAENRQLLRSEEALRARNAELEAALARAVASSHTAAAAPIGDAAKVRAVADARAAQQDASAARGALAAAKAALEAADDETAQARHEANEARAALAQAEQRRVLAAIASAAATTARCNDEQRRAVGRATDDATQRTRRQLVAAAAADAARQRTAHRNAIELAAASVATMTAHVDTTTSSTVSHDAMATDETVTSDTATADRAPLHAVEVRDAEPVVRLSVSAGSSPIARHKRRRRSTAHMDSEVAGVRCAFATEVRLCARPRGHAMTSRACCARRKSPHRAHQHVVASIRCVCVRARVVDRVA